MRVLAIGDAHLRVSDSRHTTRLRALAQILDHAHQVQPSLIVWPGDLYDRESGIPERTWMREYLQALSAVAPVLCVRGNHDAHGDGDIFAHVRANGPIYWVTAPGVSVVHTADGPLAVGCLPYPEKAGLVAADVPASEMGPAIHRALDALFLSMGTALADHATRIPTLFAGHVTVGGSELSVGQVLLGHDLSIDATHLSRLPAATAVVLNHIHKPQTLHGAHYVGSVCACNFGEVEPKRFLVLEHDGAGWQVASVPLDVPRLYHVDADASRDGFTWRVRKGPEGPTDEAPATWQGTEVRVRYRFPSADAGLLELTRAEILATFKGADRVELEPVATAEREVRAPQVMAAQSLAEKVAAWAEVAGIETSAGVLDKLALIEMADAETVIAGLQASLERRDAVAARPPIEAHNDFAILGTGATAAIARHDVAVARGQDFA